MRALLLAALLLAALPTALADEPCEPEATRVEPAPGARAHAELETRACDGGRSTTLAALDPAGRTEVAWYDDERGSGIAATRAPRVVAWTQDARGCAITVALAGATDLPCAAGPPPTPP